jgi:hypothetical protein
MQITDTSFPMKYLPSPKKNSGNAASPTPESLPMPSSPQPAVQIDTSGLFRTQATLQSAGAEPQIHDIAYFLTPSDQALFKSVTGFDLADWDKFTSHGGTDLADYSKMNPKVSPQDAFDLEQSLFRMRLLHGQDINPLTAGDISNFIKAYQDGSDFKLNMPLLEKLEKALPSSSS